MCGLKILKILLLIIGLAVIAVIGGVIVFECVAGWLARLLWIVVIVIALGLILTDFLWKILHSQPEPDRGSLPSQ